jgi:hypothetical protein
MTPDGQLSPLSRLDIRNGGTEFYLDGQLLGATAGPVRFHHGPGGPGQLLSGVWIGGRRQYGVAVYRDDAWLFSVTGSVEDADAAYDEIDALELEP